MLHNYSSGIEWDVLTSRNWEWNNYKWDSPSLIAWVTITFYENIKFETNIPLNNGIIKLFIWGPSTKYHCLWYDYLTVHMRPIWDMLWSLKLLLNFWYDTHLRNIVVFGAIIKLLVSTKCYGLSSDCPKYSCETHLRNVVVYAAVIKL